MTTVDLDAIRARLGAAVAAWSEATGDPNDALPQQASAADVPVLLELVEGLRQELDEARAERDAARAEVEKMADWAGFNVNKVRAMRPVVEAAEAYWVKYGWLLYADRDNLAAIPSLADGERFKLLAAVNAYRSATPDAEPAPRAWVLPDVPRPEVTRVRDQFGQYFERCEAYNDDGTAEEVWVGQEFLADPVVPDLTLSWEKLMRYHSPLVDATAEPAPGVPVDTEATP